MTRIRTSAASALKSGAAIRLVIDTGLPLAKADDGTWLPFILPRKKRGITETQARRKLQRLYIV